MIAPLVGEELAYAVSSCGVRRMVITMPRDEFSDLKDQFPECMLICAGDPYVVMILADDWPDIREQFPEAVAAEDAI